MSAPLTWAPKESALRYCPEPCGKRLYPSKREAKLAHWRAPWRLRAYWCDLGRGYHVTNGEKH